MDASIGDRWTDVKYLGHRPRLMTEAGFKSHSLGAFVTGHGSRQGSILGATVLLTSFLGLRTFDPLELRCLEPKHMSLGTAGETKETQTVSFYVLLFFSKVLIYPNFVCRGNKCFWQQNTPLSLASTLTATFFSFSHVHANGPVTFNHQSSTQRLLISTHSFGLYAKSL